MSASYRLPIKVDLGSASTEASTELSILLEMLLIDFWTLDKTNSPSFVSG